jgi:hypothetical protein
VANFKSVALRLLSVGLLSALVCSCSRPAPRPGPAGHEAADKPAARRTYPYELSESTKVQFLKDLGALHAQDSLDQVVKRFGEPDSRGLCQAKGYNQPIRGRWIDYIWRQPNEEPNEYQDQSVSFMFDSADRLGSVVSNVPAVIAAARAAGLKTWDARRISPGSDTAIRNCR